MFKNRIDISGRNTHRCENCWTLDKPMASLSTCHLELVVWDGNLLKKNCPVVMSFIVQSKYSFAHYFVYQVAFSSVLVVDAGRTAMLQFGRSAKEIRGKGIFHQLILREFAEFVYPKCPRIVQMRTSSVNTDFWDSKKDGTKVLLRRVLLHYFFVTGCCCLLLCCCCCCAAAAVVLLLLCCC